MIFLNRHIQEFTCKETVLFCEKSLVVSRDRTYGSVVKHVLVCMGCWLDRKHNTHKHTQTKEKRITYNHANTSSSDTQHPGDSYVCAITKITLILGLQSLERRWINLKKGLLSHCFWKKENPEFQVSLELGILAEDSWCSLISERYRYGGFTSRAKVLVSSLPHPILFPQKVSREDVATTEFKIWRKMIESMFANYMQHFLL